ncbi:MAG: cysteine desulfurase [Oscillospiraceae bacterium]|nr:cysteine desulfurase [Oscillospiraceae bacterium]
MIYFDNAATTKVSDTAAREVLRVMTENFGNPASLHNLGISAEEEIINAKKVLAKILSSDNADIVFTSSGTEANNLAIRGALYARKRRFNEYVLDSAGHESVTATAAKLKDEGFSVSEIPPLSSGSGDIEKIIEAVNEKTALVSFILVNNETGSRTDVKSAIKRIKLKNPETLIHIDCVSALCKEEISFKKLGADIITISAHKIHGPKGIGAVIIKKGVRITPLIYGAAGSLRPGTESTPLIAGFAAAAKEFYEKMAENEKTVHMINGYLREHLKEIEGVTITSPPDANDYVLNFSTNKIKSEVLLHFFEENGIYVSSGSACAKGKSSHVLTDMKLPRESVLSAVRVSLSGENTLSEAERFIEVLKKAEEVLIKSF